MVRADCFSGLFGGFERSRTADNFPDSFAIEDPRFCKFAPLIQNRDKFFGR